MGNTTLLVSFCLDELGKIDVSVLYKGNHFQGSPFQLMVTEKPAGLYRRDYEQVGKKPVLEFSSRDLSYFSGSGGSSVVACNSVGEIILANSKQIQLFNRNGERLFSFYYGARESRDSSPGGLAVDYRNDDQIVLVDTWQSCIKVFDKKGKLLRSFGSHGHANGQFSNPSGIAVSQTTGEYYVADFFNYRVQVFNANGEFLRKFGSMGQGLGQLYHPDGIGLLSNGNVVVCERQYNKRIQIFDPLGNCLQMFASHKMLGDPHRIFVDSDDNILVADSGNSEVQIFDVKGNFIKSIGKGASLNPEGVAMDPQGRILICDGYKNKVVVF